MKKIQNEIELLPLAIDLGNFSTSTIFLRNFFLGEMFDGQLVPWAFFSGVTRFFGQHFLERNLLLGNFFLSEIHCCPTFQLVQFTWERFDPKSDRNNWTVGPIALKTKVYMGWAKKEVHARHNLSKNGLS